MNFFVIFIITAYWCYCQNLDVNVLRTLNTNRNKGLDNEFNFLSNTVSIPIIATGLCYAYDFAKRKTELSKYKFEEFLISSGSVFLTTHALKYTIKRERPYKQYDFIEKAGSGGGFSMPSGHTSEAFFLAFNLSFYCPKWYVITPAVLWASLVSYSRMHLGVHFPSDVLVGIILSSAVSFAIHKYFDIHYYKNVGAN